MINFLFDKELQLAQSDFLNLHNSRGLHLEMMGDYLVPAMANRHIWIIRTIDRHLSGPREATWSDESGDATLLLALMHDWWCKGASMLFHNLNLYLKVITLSLLIISSSIKIGYLRPMARFIIFILSKILLFFDVCIWSTARSQWGLQWPWTSLCCTRPWDWGEGWALTAWLWHFSEHFGDTSTYVFPSSSSHP